jgi:transcription termination factor NusB
VSFDSGDAAAPALHPRSGVSQPTATKNGSVSPAHRPIVGSAARLAALQALYQLEITGNAPDDVIEGPVEHRLAAAPTMRRPARPGVLSDLVRGVLKHQVEIDC